MGLRNVWLRTLGDGLVRADQVVGVHTHRTPSAAGKTSHWLLDVVLPAPMGGGQTHDWAVGPLHRTLIQTSAEPTGACENLVRLLAQLDSADAAGVIDTSTDTTTGGSGARAVAVRFRFTRFRAAEPDTCAPGSPLDNGDNVAQ